MCIQLRTAIIALFFLGVLPCRLLAQEVPQYVIAGAFTYTRIERNNWTGWNASACRNVNRYLGIAVDIGHPTSWQTGNVQIYEGMTFQSDKRAYTIMAGPRATVTGTGKTAFFVQLLLGAAHESVNIENHEDGVVIHVSRYEETDFAMSLGLGVDYALKGPFAIHGQFDYTGFHKGATTLSPPYWEKGIRLSIGLSIRLGTQTE